jgi:hypothetical protein
MIFLSCDVFAKLDSRLANIPQNHSDRSPKSHHDSDAKNVSAHRSRSQRHRLVLTCAGENQPFFCGRAGPGAFTEAIALAGARQHRRSQSGSCLRAWAHGGALSRRLHRPRWRLAGNTDFLGQSLGHTTNLHDLAQLRPERAAIHATHAA